MNNFHVLHEQPSFAAIRGGQQYVLAEYLRLMD
jgi:hypothetical protein